MDTCEQFRSFVAERGCGGTLPPDAAAHRARCPECRALWEAYRRSVEAVRATQGEVPATTDPGPLLAAVRARRRRRAWAAGTMAAAAGLAAVIVGVTWLQGGRGVPVEGTRPSVDRQGTGAERTLPEVAGDAVLLTGDGPGVPVLGAAVVAEGRGVATGAGEAVLSDARIARVSLAARTRVRVERWRPERSVLRLEEGSLEAQVQPRAPGEVFEVRTPEAVVRVVGTRFVVTRLAGGGTEVVGLEGEVTVETADGRLVAHVTPGRSVRLGAEPAPEPETAGNGVALPRESPRPAAAPRAAAEAVMPDAVVAEARSLMADGRDDEALAMLRKAVAAAAPGDAARMLAALADAYRLSGRREDAAAAWERCLSAGPGPAPESAYLDYADLLASQGRSAEAARVREAYVRAWPSGRYLGRALRELAAFAELDGRPEDASDLRRRLVRDAPRSKEAVEVFVDLGLRMARSGDLDGAARWFEGKRGAESRDLAEAAWVGLMRVRFEEGRFDEVRVLADEYRRAFPVGARREEVGRLVRALPSGTGTVR